MTRAIPDWPTATYRLQFGENLSFADAAAMADDLAALGISHLYASPIFAARAGSTHGYDVTDPTRIAEHIGGRAGFDAMCEKLASLGLGLILDIVPNHMAASPENPWLADVMRHGEQSDYASFFDIDWRAGDGRLTLPVLGQPLKDALDAGELSVDTDDNWGAAVTYYEKRFPLSGVEAGGLARLKSDRSALKSVLDRQPYRLSFWRNLSELNYRRFFDITDLIGLRMEDRAVFEASHALIRELVKAGQVQGLRIDHIDGLREPRLYLDWLSEFFPGREDCPPIWVEKVLEGDEHLPAGWRTAGETGYGALSWLDGVLVAPSAEKVFTETAIDATGRDAPYREIVMNAKHEVMAQSFAHEFVRLGESLASMVDGFSAQTITEALMEIAAHFEVYRIYLHTGAVPKLGPLHAAIDHAKGDRPSLARPLEALRPVLGDPDNALALRFQQQTGPVMAKAVEDTAFYRYMRLTALNEVGGDPARFGRTLKAFHAEMALRRERVPYSITATATHDTKRGEDARARLLALSDLPKSWREGALGWIAAMRDGLGERAPSGTHLYLLLQTLVGTWPEQGAADYRGRLAQYLVKAAREGKEETSWIDQDPAYEKRLEQAIDHALTGEPARLIESLCGTITARADTRTRARTVLKLTIPGIPDIYQGTEFEERSLVDPDNRRPVDPARRRKALDDDMGEAKFALTRGLLRLRRDHPDLFARGAYQPIDLGTENVIAYRRHLPEKCLLVVAHLRGEVPSNRPLTLHGPWEDVMTGERMGEGPVLLRSLLSEAPARVFVATA